MKRYGIFLSLAVLLFSFSVLSEASPLKRPLSFQNFTLKDGLSSEMVYAIALQREEIWFGTEGGGATLFNTAKKTWKAFTTKGDPPGKDDGVSINWKNILSCNHVSVILPDGDRLWFGTYFYGFGGGGISYYQPQRNPPWKTFNTNNGQAKKVVSMAVDADTLWVGSEKGLSMLDKKKDAWKGFISPKNGLPGNFVNALLVDSEYVWAGTNSGIGRFHKTKKTWKVYAQKDGLAETEIKSLVKVGERLWAGGIGGSLFEYDQARDHWKKIEASDPLKNGGINALVAARNRVLVCRDGGVSVYDLSTGRWESISAADGLLSNSVFCAAEDKGGIWFGTDKGASKLLLKE